MPGLDGSKISYCGVVCEYCPAYRKGVCPGCDEHEGSCGFIECLKARGEENCMKCAGFPCNLHINGFEWPPSQYGVKRWRVYSKEFLDFLKGIKA